MPAANLLALLDDVASVLDDVAAMTKTATKKTAGVLGDDLALNAQQVSGIGSDRELPVVWAVAKGSLLNKAILVPVALLISVWIPMLITPLLMLGGLYLCFEGAEKCWHAFKADTDHAKNTGHTKDVSAEPNPPSEDGANGAVSFSEEARVTERQKIRGAVRTDFILSAEIIVIALGVVEGKSLLEQALTLSVVALTITIGVYGLVAAIVRLDDWGAALYTRSEGKVFATTRRQLGQGILWFAPRLMKALAWVGTLAMFLVGGGILHHSIPFLHHLFTELPLNHLILGLLTTTLEGLTGLFVGFILLILVTRFASISQMFR